jgi:asparagine synthase (glutamine-hydrolysing)
MCGVGAIIALPGAAVRVDREGLVRMAGALEHRGPDGFGVYRSDRVGLVHTRLSVVDLAGGAQPLANEREDVWVAFNGEIFNHVELRVELERRGHVFRTRSDTEVIVHAWEEWREGAFARFNGQWAIVLVDEAQREVVLARDRVGVRPLHTATHEGRLLVASEAKAIFAAAPSLPRRLDRASVAEALTFWAPLAPRTMFDGIGELAPGAVRVVNLETGESRERRIDPPAYPPTIDAFSGSIDDAAAAVGTALARAVELRVTRADVTVASYLSGGLDSTYVAALAQRCTGGRLSTFSVRFASPEFDESSFQAEAASALGTDHHAITVDDADIAAVFPDVVASTEKTLLRSAPAPLFLLSKLVREHGIKVVLTGEGADEMFAGYDLFREGKVRRFWARRPESAMRPRLLERLYPYLARSPSAQRAMAQAFFGRDLARHAEPGFAHGPRWTSASALQRLLSADVRSEWARSGRGVAALISSLPEDFARWSSLAQDQHLEIETLLSPYILSSQGDRMLMANSIEGRFPFLDAEVMRLARSLPAEYKLRVLDEKHVLKRAARPLVPAGVVARKKQPYRAPNATAFLGPSEPEWVRAIASPAALVEAGIFDEPAATGLLEKVRRALAKDARAPLSNADDMGVLAVLSTQLLALAPRPAPGAPAAPLERDIVRSG